MLYGFTTCGRVAGWVILNGTILPIMEISEEDNPNACPECGATWQAGLTCQDCFNQMLYWENEVPRRGAIHHLAVLAYHLQHPSLYSPEGLKYGLQLLEEFVERGTTPGQIRKKNRSAVDSGQREWKIRPRPGDEARYPHPVAWHMTALDVVNAGADRYIDSVREWARSILDDLRSSENI